MLATDNAPVTNTFGESLERAFRPTAGKTRLEATPDETFVVALAENATRYVALVRTLSKARLG